MTSVVEFRKRVNPAVVGTLRALLQEAEAGEIQCLAVTVGYGPTDAASAYVPSDPASPIDERAMLGQMQIAVTDVTIGLAKQDDAMYCASLPTDED